MKFTQKLGIWVCLQVISQVLFCGRVWSNSSDTVDNYLDLFRSQLKTAKNPRRIQSLRQQIEVMKELKTLNPHHDSDSAQIKVDGVAALFYGELRGPYSQIVPLGTHALSLYLMLEKIEQNRETWKDLALYDPSFEPFLTLEVQDGVQQVHVDQDVYSHSEQFFLDFGQEKELNRGAHKVITLTYRYGDWQEAAKAKLLNDANPGAIEAFEQEKKIAAALGNPNLPETSRRGLIEVYAVTHRAIIQKKYTMDAFTAFIGETNEDGTTIHPPLKMKESEKLALFSDVIYGLSTLHDQLGYVHRDIKLENMLLSIPSGKNPNERMQMVLADYGLSTTPDQWLLEPNCVGTFDQIPLDQLFFKDLQDPLKPKSIKTADLFGISVAMAKALRLELVPWSHCPDESYIECFERLVKLNERKNRAGLYSDSLSQILLQGMTPELTLRPELVEWQSTLENFRQSLSTDPLPEISPEESQAERIKRLAPQMNAFRLMEINRIKKQLVPNRKLELQNNMLEHLEKKKRYGHLNGNKNATLANIQTLLAPYSSKFHLSFHLKEEDEREKNESPCTPDTLRLVILKSGLFKNRFRLGAEICMRDHSRKVEKFYLKLHDTTPQQFRSELQEEIEHTRTIMQGVEAQLHEYEEQLLQESVSDLHN